MTREIIEGALPFAVLVLSDGLEQPGTESAQLRPVAITDSYEGPL